jgi:hypothetical protein
LPPLFDEFRANRFHLLWRDSFGTEEFHRRDGRADTLALIVDTDGNMFGGFTSVEWESRVWNRKYNNGWKGDDSGWSFLFTLRKPHGVPPRKFALRAEKKQRAISVSFVRFGGAISHVVIGVSHGHALGQNGLVWRCPNCPRGQFEGNSTAKSPELRRHGDQHDLKKPANDHGADRSFADSPNKDSVKSSLHRCKANQCGMKSHYCQRLNGHDPHDDSGHFRH